MKRIVSVCLIILMILSTVPMQAHATKQLTTDIRHIYCDDGGYLIITINEHDTRSLNVKTGSKKMEYVSASGKLCWTAVLRGNFTYDGVTSACTWSSCDVTIVTNNFTVISKDVGTYSNYAYVSLTMGKELFGLIVSDDTYELTLSCDCNGKLS